MKSIPTFLLYLAYTVSCSLYAQSPKIFLSYPIDTFFTKVQTEQLVYTFDPAQQQDSTFHYLKDDQKTYLNNLINQSRQEGGEQLFHIINFKSTTSASYFMSYGIVAEATYHFIFPDGKLVKKYSGILTDHFKLDMPVRNCFVHINLPKEETVTCIIQVRKYFNVFEINRFIISSDSAFWINHVFWFYFWQALFQGAIGLMILYNLALFLGSKDKTYLFYVGYLSCGIILFFLGFGFLSLLFPHLSQSTAFVIYIGSRILAYGIVIFYLIFMRLYLDTHSITPALDLKIKLYTKIRAFLIPFIVMVDIFINHNGGIFLFILPIDMCFIVWALIKAMRSGDYLIRYFISGSLVLVLATILMIISILFGNAKLLPDIFLQIGLVIEAILFSVGLGYRSRRLAEEKRKAQRQLILEQERINAELEHIVSIRTKEVESQHKQLALKNRKLEESQKVLMERHETILSQKETLENTLDRLQKTQVQLVQAEKLASLGQLTAGIAHEINNPINFVSASILPLKQDLVEIKSLLQFISDWVAKHEINELSDLEDIYEDYDVEYLLAEMDNLLQGIEEGADRTKEIVLGLKRFSRIDENEFKYCDINEGIISTLKLLHHETKNRVNVSTDFGENVRVECLPGRMNQVFMNIITNAIQAIEGKGSIYIKTRTIGETVEISIRDTGKGIDDQVKRRIFEPFFTTKPVGMGTGLGLSISYGIIERHQGFITVNSELEEGTEFIISIPVKRKESTSIDLSTV